MSHLASVRSREIQQIKLFGIHVTREALLGAMITVTLWCYHRQIICDV
jgi:hypothetical protein